MTPTDAYYHLTAMYSHRDDGIPTQFYYHHAVRDAAEVLYRSFPEWFGPSVAVALLNGGSLTLDNKQLLELAESVLEKCDCTEQNCTDCHNMGYTPRGTNILLTSMS